MKKKNLIITLSVLAVGLLAGRYLIPSGASLSHDHETMELSTAEATTWTCSMHPQIQQPGPGDCPICGMDLIPLVKDSGHDDGPRTMSMSESSRALADIQTTLVRRDFAEAEVRLVGKLDYDETKLKSLTARFPARIDELFVNYNGIRVNAGEHLAKVYSPELLSAQRELITAYRSNPQSAIVTAVRSKLRLWDLLPDQIDAILESGEAKDHFVLRAPIGGVVIAKHIKEGDYIKTGEPLFKIADLSELWLNLDAYESDLPWLRYGQDVNFTVESIPGESFTGKVTFIDPELNRKTRTVAVRVNVPNKDQRLKPGMFARGVVKVKMGKDGKVFAPQLAGKWISPMHPKIVKDGPGSCDVCGMDLVPAETLGYVESPSTEAPILIPASAVLRTGKRAVVYIQKPDTERPTYEGREVVLGPRAGDFYLVRSSIEEGERIVTNGAFKIDSALQIQAKPSMMGIPEESPEVVPSDLALKVALLDPYLKLQSALAADDLAAAKLAIKSMMQTTGHHGPVADLVHLLAGADSLDAIRRPHFEALSNQMINAIRQEPQAFGRDLYLMNCSMVYKDRSADWVQSTDELLNPYWGSQMLHCGSVKGKIGE